MNEFFIASGAILLFGAGVHAFLRQKRTKKSVGKSVENVKRGRASPEEILSTAVVLAQGLRRLADKLNKPAMFLTACGDLYEDFFPVTRPDSSLSHKEQANQLMSAFIRRYTETAIRSDVAVADINDFRLCEGAGMGLCTFRRLAEFIPGIVPLIHALAPVLGHADRDLYASFYREAGRLASVPMDRVEAGLSGRLAAFSGGTAREGAEPSPVAVSPIMPME